MRHVFPFFVLVSALFAGALPAAETPLNVLFIAVDDLRVELGCYGDTPAITPHVDRLARRGVLFERAYCQQAVCNPSRASLLTGRRPDTLRLWNLNRHFRDTLPDVVTLPQRFKEAGYFTQNIGKVFHNWRTKIQGDPVSWSVPAVMHYATHGSDKPAVDGELPPSTSTAISTERRDVPDDAYFDGRIADLAVKALGELKDRPFFLGVGFWKPHLPFNAPARYWDLYDRAKLSLPANPEPPENVPAVALHNGRELLGRKGRELSPEEVLELRHGYYAAISYFDAQVGKLLDELRRLDLEKRTVVVFWSDHGFHLGEHGLWCKTSNFELDARVPLIIATPQPAHPGARTRGLVELLDLYPTLLDLCGLATREIDAGLEGVSLRPLLEDPDRSVRSAACTQHPRPPYFKGPTPPTMGYSVRTDRYRYTEWRDFGTGGIQARELYDHTQDPGENHNVVASPPDAAAFQDAVRLLEATFPRKPGEAPPVGGRDS